MEPRFPLRAWAAKNAGAVRFAVAFSAIAAALFTVYCFPYAEHGRAESGFRWYLQGYAQLAGGLLGLLEPSLVVIGNQIRGRFALEIVKNCDAMEANILFASAVLAFPAAWWRRLNALFFGLLILITVNLFRICSLYYIGVHAHEAFELAHMELFPLLLVLATVLEFILWTNWMSAPQSPRPS